VADPAALHAVTEGADGVLYLLAQNTGRRGINSVPLLCSGAT
jgi:hypothetical protein